MTQNADCLHGILREQTRRRIILVLHDQGSVAYSDLLAALKTQDRGRLNYHLKALTPLLNKTESGYSLNEEGQRAWRMLQEFAYTQKKRLATIVKYGRNGVALGLIAAFFAAYYQHLDAMGLIGYAVALSALTVALAVTVKVQCGRLSCCRSVDCIDASLHETLTDQTRRKIVSLLRENGPLSYTELMAKTGVGSSGQMNYHLKILGDVLGVDEQGRYSLTQKGVFAYTSQHVEGKTNLLKMNSLKQQYFGIALVSGLFILADTLLYQNGRFTLETAALNMISTVLVSATMFYLAKVNDDLRLYKVKDTSPL